MIPPEVERSLLRGSTDGFFEFSIATTSDSSSRKLVYSQIEFGRKSVQPPRAPAEWDYGPMLLRRTNLSFEEGNLLLSQLYGGAQLTNQELTAFSPMTGENPSSQFVPSRAPFYHFSRQWPLRYSGFNATQQSRGSAYGGVLAKSGLPLYPSGQEAIRGFFVPGRGQDWTFNDFGKVSVIVPDFRARIEEFRIGYHQISVKAVRGEEDLSSLRCKVYAEDRRNSTNSDDMTFRDGVATVKPPFEPSRVTAVVLDATDGSLIDSRDWFPGYIYPEYATVERPEQQIRDLIAAGEGKRIEFKGALDDHNKDDFLETVVAFANSDGGLLLLGISDNRTPVGFKADPDSITKMIRDSCEPTIEPSFKEYELDGYPVLSIEISIGQDKPYMLKHKGVIYVRIGPNDVPASRLELDQLTKQVGRAFQ